MQLPWRTQIVDGLLGADLVGLVWDGIIGLFAARLGTRLARGIRAAAKLNVAAGLTFGLVALAQLADVLFAG